MRPAERNVPWIYPKSADSGKLNLHPIGKNRTESTRRIEMRRRLPGHDGYWLLGKSWWIKPIPTPTDPLRGDHSSNRGRLFRRGAERARAYNWGRDLHPEAAVP